MTQPRVATLADLDDVTSILADAFLDDPVMTWMFPDVATRPRLTHASYRYIAEHGYLPRERSHVVDDVAAALWMPAGTSLDDTFWAEHGARYAESVEWHVDRGQQLADAMSEAHPTEPHRYLLAIGVRSSAQGRGLGGALLDHALRSADLAREPAYLEATTPRSRALYERHGFEVTSEISLEDGPTMWPMWREPQTPSST